MTIKPNNHKADKKIKYAYNPFEVAVSGKQTKDKSIFSASVIKAFGEEFKIGQVIEQTPKNALSETITEIKNIKKNSLLINNDFYSNTNNDKLDMITQRALLNSSDLVIVDQENNSNLPKILYINKNDELEYLKSFENVFAYTGDKKIYESLQTEITFLSEKDVLKIRNTIISFFKDKDSKSEIYGLVLTGGKSLRMSQDKALLEYHDKPQYQYVYQLLTTFCQKVFISCRKEQEKDFKEEYEKIYDTFLDIGPSGGILSAMNQYPDKTFLVVACDLPFVNKGTLEFLLKNRNEYKFATAYISTSDNFPEPLCAVYEPKSKARMLQLLGLGYDCPRKFLINSEVKLLEQTDKKSLDNINTPEEYEKVHSLVKTFKNSI